MNETGLRNPRYVAILAVACCLILIGGWMARPRDIPHSPAPLPSETELEQLARRTERRSLASTANYFAGVAREVGSSVARIRGAAASGIAWDDRRIVTAPIPGGRFTATVATAAGSGDAAAEPILRGPNLPLGTIAVQSGLAGLTPASRAASLPPAGDWIVAVWRTDHEAAFAAGTFRQSASIACGGVPVQEVVSSLLFTTGMAGGGLFDLDGGLLAIILPCRDRLAAIAIASVQTLLDGHDTAAQRLLGIYGLALGPLAAAEASYFKAADGILVREVWTGYPGEAAGLRPGDIISELDGTAVRQTDEIGPLTTTSRAPVGLTVQRRSKRLTILLSAEPQQPGPAAAGVGVTLDDSRATYRIDTVRAGSRAADAGIQPGDVIVRIDQAEPRSEEQVRRLFGAEPPVPRWVEVERGLRRVGMLVQ